MQISRRSVIAAATASSVIAPNAQSKGRRFTGAWSSLASGYQTPDWFRDAKLGFWAHWGPQCIAEFGDWYARSMYLQGDRAYDHHVKTYGHPAQFGFMELLKNWTIDAWDPDRLVGLYKKAGAKYFVAMAGHHDNFDMFDSKYQAWNIAKVGPKRDTMAGWAKAARDHGLRFGLSNHLSHAWHWWQTAYGYDPEGPVRGLRYDAYRLKKADGRGLWWDGLDPQELYTGPQGDMVPPEGIDTIKAMGAYHEAHSGQWLETVPPHDPYFVKKWLARTQDMIDTYKPDLLYFDDYGLPLEQAGLDAAAYFYNRSLDWHGKVDVVINGKKLDELQRRAIVEDVERGFSDHLRPLPWQTDTCIGNWHYDRPLYERDGYKTAKQVIQRLCDVVSKNGNLLLNIPVRADGSIDEKEEKIVTGVGEWLAINGDAIFATRPWDIYGEGPFLPVEGMMNEGDAKPFTYEDIRYTTKGGALYAIAQDWPDSGFLVLTCMASGRPQRKGRIDRVELLGHGQALDFELGMGGLTIKLPGARPSFTPALKIMGEGLTA
ncbi:alpha-L-fucosidase [Asticcacaulis sp. 201]|uniref:alpha-L-fucosidase n=1 Tax=Asticcacaulis sp. 201 TaxID=3028787 RepID=UPI002916F2C9|nr:alpha-L-fucosidase [Asticcacaulis sp. 201]MDV6330896.1 alpha-L-fucosidase [Asticcacaulis sp. 201]